MSEKRLNQYSKLLERAIISDSEYAAAFLDTVDPDTAVDDFERLPPQQKGAISRFLDGIDIGEYRVFLIGTGPTPVQVARNRTVARLVFDHITKARAGHDPSP